MIAALLIAAWSFLAIKFRRYLPSGRRPSSSPDMAIMKENAEPGKR